jgi:hypothetical protein
MTVFPIGHYMGERHPEGLHYVRVGLQHQTMTANEFGVWVLSHENSPQWSIADVLSLAAKANLPDAESSAERLLSVGLLVKAIDKVAFTQSYRLEPLQTGIGNSQTDPDKYEIGIPGQEPATVDAGSYELWQWSALAPTLWHTCEIRAKVAEPPVPPTDMVDEVLTDLRPLLANSCGYLDQTQ